ncbi:hypothetical protein [uncultured Pelagimonas sp.]|uniref:hypothetical protein n=1 Tax=uncultured Pelagimonas sp. TaxID=1618102 RepID=UPI002635F937|nr:hypothetical protein [uncultured Pelagimonas sp.]
MALDLNTDYVNINRGGTPGTAGSGTEGPAKLKAILLASVAVTPSADPATLAAYEGTVAWFGGNPYLWTGTAYKRVATFAAVNTGLINDAGNFFTTDNVEEALQQLGGDVRDYDLLLGRPANSTHLGTFTGNTIPNNVSVKAALQALETALEALAGDWIGQAELT